MKPPFLWLKLMQTIYLMCLLVLNVRSRAYCNHNRLQDGRLVTGPRLRSSQKASQGRRALHARTRTQIAAFNVEGEVVRANSMLKLADSIGPSGSNRLAFSPQVTVVLSARSQLAPSTITVSATPILFPGEASGILVAVKENKSD